MKSHALTVNLHQLERRNVLLEGELDPEALDLQAVDPLIRVVTPLRYAVEAQLLDRTVLAKGELELRLECACVRCLKKFMAPLELGDWMALLPLQGEDSVPVNNDSVDLTPFVREDILLAFPRHPLCSPGCPGLPYSDETGESGKQVADQANPSAWNELNKLKF